MEIKINFDQLFGAPNELNTTQETPSSQHEPSLPSRSDLSSLSDSFDYRLDPQLFPTSPQNILIDSSEQDHRSIASHQSVRSPKSNQTGRVPQPGERLFY